jgi:hypothetical protein
VDKWTLLPKAHPGRYSEDRTDGFNNKHFEVEKVRNHKAREDGFDLGYARSSSHVHGLSSSYMSGLLAVLTVVASAR